jgi:hypothetical protein
MDDKRKRQVNLIFIMAVAVGGAIGSVMRYLVGIGAGRLFGTRGGRSSSTSPARS